MSLISIKNIRHLSLNVDLSLLYKKICLCILHLSFQDVCVKASAVVNGTVVKNKKTGVTKKNPNPVFNEMIRFDLDNGMTLENTTIMLSVNAYRSRGPHKRLVGRTYIGNGDLVPPAGMKYWRKIIENPQKMIAEWHEIQ